MKEQEIKLELVSRRNWTKNNEAQTLHQEIERQDSPQTGRKIQSQTAGHPFLKVTELEIFKEQERWAFPSFTWDREYSQWSREENWGWPRKV